MEEHNFHQVNIENWNDWFRLDQSFLSSYVFRGQSNAEWELSTSLERFMNRIHPSCTFGDTTIPYNMTYAPDYESESIKDFSYRYPLYKTDFIPDNDNYIEWLSIMQHYGAPTRLLDFCRSLYVAIFMAITNSSSDNSSVWALQSSYLDSEYAKRILTEKNATSVRQDVILDTCRKLANEAIAKPIREDQGVLKIDRIKINERLHRQQGLFIMPINIRKTFMGNLSLDLSREASPIIISIEELIDYSCKEKNMGKKYPVIKFVINRDFNFQLAKSLQSMNITSELLFPGLDGLAKSMQELRWSDGNYRK